MKKTGPAILGIDHIALDHVPQNSKGLLRAVGAVKEGAKQAAASPHPYCSQSSSTFYLPGFQ